MKKFLQIENGVIVNIFVGKKPKRIKTVEVEYLSQYRIGSRMDAYDKEGNAIKVEQVDTLLEKKERLKEKVRIKTNSLISYLSSKYEQSNRLGVIDDIKGELDYFKTHRADYEAVAGTDSEEAYVQGFYPTMYTYMKVKKRTFIEQVTVAKYKRELTALVSSKTEAFLSEIGKIETEEELEGYALTVAEIERLKTVKEFMLYMGKDDG